MKPPRTVIVEDEPVLRAELKETLAKLWPELDICAEAKDGIEALRALDAHAPEIVFLDIQLPGMTGLEVARKASGKSHVVFVTAYDKYAVEAFEQGAVDYVMKPITAARLATTVSRLKAKTQSPPANLEVLLQTLAAKASGKAYMRWITVSQGQNLRLITIEEICYFQADNKYTLVATADTQSLIRKPIKELIDELDPTVFWQIHRSTLVNVNAIAGIHRDLRGHLHVRLRQRKETLAVSESYTHLFKSM